MSENILQPNEIESSAKTNAQRFGFAGEKIGEREITEEFILHSMGKGLELVNFTEKLSDDELKLINDTLGSDISKG